MANIPISTGIGAITPGQIPDQWSKSWFIQFLNTWLAQGDIRNATAGPGITISGQGTIPATVSSTIGGIEAASFVVVSTNPLLTGERILTAQSGVTSITDGGAGNPITVGIVASGIGVTQLNQAIAPTWTGLHIFDSGVTFQGGTLTANSLATTGAQAATFSATNKPGATSKTSPDKWIPITCDGVVGSIPWFAN